MQDIKNYIEKVKCHGLPRWEQLPDFELYMDQVISLMQKYIEPYILKEDALTPSMINNYVKMEALPAPIKKRYSKDHIARLIVICLMKKQLSIPTISNLIRVESEEKGIDVFYNSFIEEYELAAKNTLLQIKGNNTLKGALSLAISAAANHTTAQYTVDLLLPDNETDKKDKKESKKENKKESKKDDKNNKKSSE